MIAMLPPGTGKMRVHVMIDQREKDIGIPMGDRSIHGRCLRKPFDRSASTEDESRDADS